MYIKGAPVLRIVNNLMHINAAQFVKSLTTEHVREIILTLWVAVYNELLNTLVFDDGSQFRDTFGEICEIHDVEWQRSGKQHNSAFRTRERYYEPIRCTTRKL